MSANVKNSESAAVNPWTTHGLTSLVMFAAFLDVEASGQAELLQTIGDARPDGSATHAGTRLFGFLKQETVRGFYTSRLGLKELDYKGESFYGQSPGCGLPLRFRPTANGQE